MTMYTSCNKSSKTRPWCLLASFLLVAPLCASAASKVNDTGVITCSNATQNDLPCPQKGFLGQDAENGRDKTNKDNKDGYAGFSFKKIGDIGQPLVATAPKWNCVKDNVTGLTWEIKTNDGGLHDMDWTYSWYDPRPTKNGGYPGIKNGGVCANKKACDTYSYVNAVNKSAAGWCGRKDWRLPTVEELLSIALLDRAGPAIDKAYFPEKNIGIFWTSTPYVYIGSAGTVWHVNFQYGFNNFSFQGNGHQVRLVRKGK